MSDPSGPSRPSEPPRLGALEAQVMEILWDHGASSIREVIGRLPTDPAYTTIATVLTNLDRKGFVRSVREGRTVRYLARLSREQHAATLIDHALGSSGDRAASILQFVDAMRDSELELLREYLDRRDTEASP